MLKSTYLKSTDLKMLTITFISSLPICYSCNFAKTLLIFSNTCGKSKMFLFKLMPITYHCHLYLFKIFNKCLVVQLKI